MLTFKATLLHVKRWPGLRGLRLPVWLRWAGAGDEQGARVRRHQQVQPEASGEQRCLLLHTRYVISVPAGTAREAAIKGQNIKVGLWIRSRIHDSAGSGSIKN